MMMYCRYIYIYNPFINYYNLILSWILYRIQYHSSLKCRKTRMNMGCFGQIMGYNGIELEGMGESIQKGQWNAQSTRWGWGHNEK